jgi:hypothetical protein
MKAPHRRGALCTGGRQRPLYQRPGPYGRPRAVPGGVLSQGLSTRMGSPCTKAAMSSTASP